MADVPDPAPALPLVQAQFPTTPGGDRVSDPDPIVAFLNARLEEDADVAEAAQGHERSNWQPHTSVGDEYNYAIVTDDVDIQRARLDDHGERVASCGEEWPSGDERAEHIARHDPDRVLADVRAKRQIIGEHRPALWQPECFGCSDSWPCLTLRAFASVYRDHPDFDPSWAS